jgi:hypothetical protein
MENPDFEIAAAGWNTDFEKNFTRPETRAWQAVVGIIIK